MAAAALSVRAPFVGSTRPFAAAPAPRASMPARGLVIRAAIVVSARNVCFERRGSPARGVVSVWPNPLPPPDPPPPLAPPRSLSCRALARSGSTWISMPTASRSGFRCTSAWATPSRCAGVGADGTSTCDVQEERGGCAGGGSVVCAQCRLAALSARPPVPHFHVGRPQGLACCVLPPHQHARAPAACRTHSGVFVRACHHAQRCPVLATHR